MEDVAGARRRDGATAWVPARDVERPEAWLETFGLPDWLELHRGAAQGNLVDAAATGAARALIATSYQRSALC
jgi:Transmembrane secretion effector